MLIVKFRYNHVCPKWEVQPYPFALIDSTTQDDYQLRSIGYHQIFTNILPSCSYHTLHAEEHDEALQGYGIGVPRGVTGK